MTPERFFFPYVTQSASALKIDALTLYAGSDGQVATVAPLPAAGMPLSLKGPSGSVALSLPRDAAVLTGQVDQLVFMVLAYHLGA
jgi:hypothetical protein